MLVDPIMEYYDVDTRIYWITGRANSGKTTLAYELKDFIESHTEDMAIVLDGDEIREVYPTGFSGKEREQHIFKIAALAALLENQGFIVIIALVSPMREWRIRARMLFSVKSKLIYLKGGTLWENTLYEEPEESEY